jgi:hypothetical protein
MCMQHKKRMFFAMSLSEKYVYIMKKFTVHVLTLAGGRVRLWAINLDLA